MGNIVRESKNGQLAFWCPGCNTSHHPNGNWGWNGSIDKPTFTPSVLVKSGHFASHKDIDDSCWCTYYTDHPEEPRDFHCGICHSFVTDGKIQFLTDSTHTLAGQTVELLEWPDGT